MSVGVPGLGQARHGEMDGGRRGKVEGGRGGVGPAGINSQSASMPAGRGQRSSFSRPSWPEACLVDVVSRIADSPILGFWGERQRDCGRLNAGAGRADGLAAEQAPTHVVAPSLALILASVPSADFHWPRDPPGGAELNWHQTGIDRDDVESGREFKWN